MTVQALLSAVTLAHPEAMPAGALGAGLDVPVTGITFDSRAVVPGYVFVGLKGQKFDGSAFARQAVAAGAVVIVADQPEPEGGVGAPWLHVADARQAMAWLAAELHGHPSRELRVVGVTGTNGKTTTSYLLHAIFEAAGIRAGLMGTVAYRVADREVGATRTTPEAPDLQQFLREMVTARCGACVMEVSSHALALHRVDGIRFAAAIFTNLTRDHLDFHGDMESYFAAKRRLFELLPDGAPAIVNLDDPRGAELVALAPRAVTYSVNYPADVTPGPLRVALEGLRFEVRTPAGTLSVRSVLVGRPNVSNILAAVATAVALDVPLDAIERGIAGLRGVPGRFEVVSDESDDITVVVDYAHTDDALRNLVETARQLAPARVITVFGCGGDRDRSKRPLMGMVAARQSDVVVVTSDNPRGEDPARIIEEVVRGAQAEARQAAVQILTLPDRHEAIAEAVRLAEPRDVVLLAGKGHEKYQDIGGQHLPFDDVATAREALGARRLRRVG